MRRNVSLSTLMIASCVSLLTLVVGLLGALKTEAASAPSLVISQLKITSSGGQFVTLYNATDTQLDMSKYQLEYFNNYDLTKATSSRLIALSGTVPPHGYFMINDDSLLLCYRLTIDSSSLGFSSTAGMVEVLSFNQTNPGGSVTPGLEDYVGWSKTAAAGAQTLPVAANAFLQRQPTDAQSNPSIGLPGGGTWQSVQPDTKNPCNLITTGSLPSDVSTGLNQLLPGSEPAATIIGSASAGQAVPSLPASDIGLMAPSITELLPNPNGSGNDSTDEFIEVYNPNPKSFDLSGFGLQTGVTSTHNFTFPSGTILPALSFTAVYSSKSGLSLSNSGSQAKLLDPFGNSISSSGMYGMAKDGQAWALAKGKWYWTSQPTPGKANVIRQPTSGKSSSKKASAKKSKVHTGKTTPKIGAANVSDEGNTATPVHVWILAIIAGGALLYGAYEYRTDLANYFHQFKRNITDRRSSR